MCCWCPPSYWDVRTKKCYSAWAIIIGVLLVIASILVPIFMPDSLQAVATAQAKDVLAIPAKGKTKGQFIYDDWLNNDNAKWHPPSFRKFYFYNITNTDFVAVITGKEKLQVEKVGPIAFKKKWTRYKDTVEFVDNNDRVCYEFGVEFEFDSSKSQAGLTPDSVLQMLNVPYLGGLVEAVTLGNTNNVESSIQTYLPLMCSLTSELRPAVNEPGLNKWFENCSVAAETDSFLPFDTPYGCRACLFMNTTIKDLLFGSRSNVLDLLFRRTIFSRNGGLNQANSPELFATSSPLFTTCANKTDCYNKKALQTAYGLGGACQQITDIYPNDLFPKYLVTPGLCVPPGNITHHTSSIKQCQYTGLNDDCFTKSFDEETCQDSKVRQFSQWMGNTTTMLWGDPHPVIGAFDQEPQFHPFVQDDDTLSLWIPDVMRAFDIQYDSKQEWRGLNLKRFKPVDSIFGINGADHELGYGQSKTLAGFIESQATTLVKYGVGVPLYLSQPGYSGADLSNPILNGVDCVHVVDGKKQKCTESDEGIYVDIEPTFGKVVRGGAGAQVNFKLESKYFKFLFGNLNVPSPYMDFVNGTDIMLPFLIFSDTAVAEQGQTDLLKNSLNLLKVLPTLPWVIYAILMVLGGLFIILGAFFLGRVSKKALSLRKEENKELLSEPLLFGGGTNSNVEVLRQSLDDFNERLSVRVTHLKEENANLADEAGEAKLHLEAPTNVDDLLKQIRTLEGTNNRLRETVDPELGQPYED